MLEWNLLTQSDDMYQLIRESSDYPLLIFKHSSHCHVSSIAKMRLESHWDASLNVKPYFLDIFKSRHLSDRIADIFNVEHESPQVLVIYEGRCVQHNSHLDISTDRLKDYLWTPLTSG